MFYFSQSRYLFSSFQVIFNNITLVSTQGFYQTNVSENIRSCFLVKKNFLQGRFLDEINLRTYVNSVIGKLTEIRRKDRILVINNNSALPYDLLFLMTGEIYLRPYNDLIQQSYCHKPVNLFIINCAADASTSLLKLKSLHNELTVSDCKLLIFNSARFSSFLILCSKVYNPRTKFFI